MVMMKNRYSKTTPFGGNRPERLHFLMHPKFWAFLSKMKGLTKQGIATYNQQRSLGSPFSVQNPGSILFLFRLSILVPCFEIQRQAPLKAKQYNPGRRGWNLFPLLLLLFSACIPGPVEIEVAQAEPELVVASQMLVDGFLLVQVSRSFGALEYSESAGDSLSDDFLEQILADSALVTLGYRDETDTLLGIGQGFYLSLGTPFEEGEIYSLNVYDYATGLRVFAQSEVLPQANWYEIGVELVPETVSLFDTLLTDTTLRLYAAFADQPGESYYMLNTYRFSSDGRQTNLLFQSESSSRTAIYADQLYPGEIIRDTLSFSGFYPGDTVAFALSHISKGYYEYLSTRQRSGTSLFANLLQEPVNFPSNVQGGYGYFNLHLPRVEVRILE